MASPRRRIGLIGGAALVAGVALLGGAALGLDRLALALLRPPHRAPARTPADVGMQAQDWTVPGDPALEGWWIEGGDPAGPVVLLAHGWGANGAALLPLAQAAAPVSAAVALWDVRGHGRSDRAARVSIRQFRDDALRAVQAAGTRLPGRPLLLVGHSMGGAAGILAAREGAPLAGLVLIATPWDVFGAIARYLRERGLPGGLLVPLLKPFWRVRVGVPARTVHPGRALTGLALRTLVIQPERDTRVPPRDGERLARAAGTEAMLVAGADHTDVLTSPQVAELLRDFVAATR
ncbi:MAG: alpha/beta fold hydrolase [Longimicrobiales bacterium]|nr:alpha/beta fold hydrolase [Longimicrobiales bacterium]